MDKCGICLKPAVQLFETGNDGVYACFKCQPLVPEVTIEDNADQSEIHDGEIGDDLNVVKQEEVSDYSLYCGICQKTFQKNAQLQNHIRNHRAERRFVCTYCNKAFSQSNNLRAHLRIHTNERPYKCNECGKAFTQVTNLNNHVRLHTGERPFVCPEPGCNKAYAQVTNLNQHRKRHLNGRPVETTYDCTICGEQFDQRNHMYNHRRDVHSELGVGSKANRSPRAARHVCELCSASLPTQRALQLHVARHANANSAPSDASEEEDTNTTAASPLSCVFRACGARFGSAHEHTEHLLSAHQLRVLSARAALPPKRGRPRKQQRDADADKVQSSEEDPLEIKETEFRPIKIINAQNIQFVPKLKIQSLFQ